MVDLDLDTVDGNFPSSLENKPTLSSVKIEQREPKMEMKVEVIFFIFHFSDFEKIYSFLTLGR